MSLRNYAWNIQKQSVTIHFDNGDALVWPSTHANFDKVKTAIKENRPEAEIRDLMNVVEQLKATFAPAVAKSGGSVVVTRDGVTYNGRVIHMTVCSRILEHAAENIPVQPLINFLEKLLNGNQSRSAVESLYDFLEANKIPIAEDGDFIVYKRVRGDYKDIHSGTFDNSVGQKLRIPAWEVVEDRERTCAAGLHVCSRQYLPHFGSGGGNRVVICKVNPADVIAVPRDYNNAKMRVCAYEVIGELNDAQKAEIFDNARIVRPGDFQDDVTWGDNFAAESESEPEDIGEPEYDDPSYTEDELAEDADTSESTTLGCPDPDCPICASPVAPKVVGTIPAQDSPQEEPTPEPPKPSPWRFGWFNGS